jgi:hypothetical protein
VSGSTVSGQATIQSGIGTTNGQVGPRRGSGLVSIGQKLYLYG